MIKVLDSSKNKKVLLVLLLLACLFGAAYAYTLEQGSVVYERTVTAEEGPLLTLQIQNWIQEHRNEPKISSYAYTGDGVYELLLVDNRNDHKNQYLNTNVSTRLKGSTLYITYTDMNATDDSDVQYNQETYLILKEPPSFIKISINGDEQILEPVIGNEPITQ
jgi:hypothetical protein